MEPQIIESDDINCRTCVPGELASPTRLRLLRSSGLLQGHPRLDRLTRLASELLKVPTVLVSLVDIDRQVFASHVGLDAPHREKGETPLSHSFCQYVVTKGEPLIVRDAREEVLLRSNKAIEDLQVIAYAGFPIVCREQVMGSFCAIRSVPHEWCPLELELLSQFAEAVSDQVEIRIDYEELKLATDNLREANDELENMADILAHDLSTPLRGIRGYLYMFQDTAGELPEESKELLQEVNQSAARMSELIEALSKFGNALHSSGKMETLDANDLFDTVCKDLSDEVSRTGARVERESNLGKTVGVRPLLRQLFQNLISNAIKFQPKDQAAQIRVGRRLDDGAFYVKDNGVGIEEKAQEKIFELYRKGHDGKKFSGMGLGLAICARIVSKHNGRIWVESAAGDGSTFYFLLRGRSYEHEVEESE